MRLKWLVFAMALLIAASGSAPATAAVIHLDGIANAGWYNDDLDRAHLYVANLDEGGYYYQWKYSPDNPTPLWNSREALAAELATGILNGNPIGNWRVESAGDVFNHPEAAIWKSLEFLPGTYNLKLTETSRAYQLNAYLWPNENNFAPVWNAYVQMYAVFNDGGTQSFNFGDWSMAGGSESEVLAAYRNLVLTITLDKPGTIYFYINDYNAVDNAGSVTLEFNGPPPAPLPGSLLLLGSGLAALLTWRRRQ